MTTEKTVEAEFPEALADGGMRRGADRREAVNGRRKGENRRKAEASQNGGTERRARTDRRNGMDRRRGPGRRLGELRRAAEEGQIAGDLLEFINALDEYKKINNRPFPSWSEIFEVVHYLGYRKVAPKADHINHACAPGTFDANITPQEAVFKS